MKNQIDERKGITLIALVITIIVLLILAGVTIATLTGDNGLLTKAGEATEKNSIGTEKEQIALAATTVSMDDKKDVEEREEMFQNQLDKYTGENKTKVYATDSNYTIHFLETNRLYTINEEGNIVEEDIAMITEDSTAGAFDGAGSQKNPYKIMSIEDLVYFSKEVCNGNTYSGKYIELGKPLDFKSKLSYKNIETTYSYDEATTSYIPDENSETMLMELCTKNMGFIPIGNSSKAFSGNFNGNNYTISNLYENTSGYAGLFGVSRGKIKKVKVSANIKSSGTVGGIVGQINNNSYDTIEGCFSEGTIEGSYAGGIAGQIPQNGIAGIVNCINYSKINATNYAGGILGFAGWNAVNGCRITNCNNYGEIYASTVGGIVGDIEAGYANIKGCLNNSKIIGTNHAGGILGSTYIAGVTMVNCGNNGGADIEGENCAGGLYGTRRNYGTICICNSYNIGKVSGSNSVNGIGPATNIENSYFGGKIENGKNVSAISNWTGGTYLNCYYINTASNVEKEGITALSEEDMRGNDTLFNSLKSYINNKYELSEWRKDTNQYPIHSDQ